MSRSGYTDEEDYNGQFAMWRGQVKNAIRGQRGQAFLREMLAALDGMPEKRLIAKHLRQDGEVCGLGCVGARRGMDLEKLDPEDPSSLAEAFGIARQLVAEIEFINDDDFSCGTGWPPEKRWERVRAWVAENITADEPPQEPGR